MATKKIKTPKLKVRGIALFPKTDRAYSFSQTEQKSVPDEDGKLSLNIIVSAEAAKPLIDAVTAYAKENGKPLKTLKNLPWKAQVEKDTGDETGNLVFNAWQYGKDKDGNVKSLPHWDRKGNKLAPNFRLTGGSEVIAAVRPSYYKGLGGGICFYLDAVQVVKLREYEDNPFSSLDEDEGDDMDDATAGDDTGVEDGTESTDF